MAHFLPGLGLLSLKLKGVDWYVAVDTHDRCW